MFHDPNLIRIRVELLQASKGNHQLCKVKTSLIKHINNGNTIRRIENETIELANMILLL